MLEQLLTCGMSSTGIKSSLGLFGVDTSMAPDQPIPVGAAQNMEQLLSHQPQGRTGAGGVKTGRDGGKRFGG